MKCIYCGYTESRVIDSRPLDEGSITRRRRECLKCGCRFTTYERPERLPVMVIKKDGTRQEFDLQKVKRSIMKACEKRSIGADEIERILCKIEKQVYTGARQEVSSTVIGELVMAELKEVDEVAYVRFASVYKQFKDISSFAEEMNKLIAEK